VTVDPDAATTAAREAVYTVIGLPGLPSSFQRAWTYADAALNAARPLIAAEARDAGADAERQRIRHDLIDGDPGLLEARFRAILDDEEAAECAGIVADLLDGDTP
jgi:hypothetical protein